ncbi:hypothetical protein LHP98_04745 [Rhodobacter sp. Har01]|uniref:hypothetical protein n=1 Tax=Rhodobacter sp. Har01 TaxID=2883999 RepID=UPI001D06BC6B|nr:hypothetical protein [Rhodobacter sp. Har01]MCB6177437.1 hypothetical protein [Rhodobacter sp. Har01]
MTTRTALATLALALLPSLAAANGCHDGMKEITASSCAEGMVWDMAKGQCVLQPTS